ncbi:hypothetical protein NDU88_001461 [Pleurodeles waltl]|uniref:Uncharacterized protein n=1 Tax=Pleurodeles waltl TaxID=8319 RepID=A0AAV7Q4D7_PLEWA|nr:hypothetical protein NDU88_001461 [Pleurodeles waltl]
MWRLTPLDHSGSLRNTALEADCPLAKQGEFTLFSTGHLRLHTTQHFPPWEAPLGAVLGRAFPAPFPSLSRPCLQRVRSPLRSVLSTPILSKEEFYGLIPAGVMIKVDISLRLKTTHTHILQFASRFPQDSTQRSTFRPGRRRCERS